MWLVTDDALTAETSLTRKFLCGIGTSAPNTSSWWTSTIYTDKNKITNVNWSWKMMILVRSESPCPLYRIASIFNIFFLCQLRKPNVGFFRFVLQVPQTFGFERPMRLVHSKVTSFRGNTEWYPYIAFYYKLQLSANASIIISIEFPIKWTYNLYKTILIAHLKKEALGALGKRKKKETRNHNLHTLPYHPRQFTTS